MKMIYRCVAIFIALIELIDAKIVFPSEIGVCTTLVNYTATRYVPYRESYRVSKWGIFYDTNYRWNLRKEKYTAYETKEVCCRHYTMSEDGTCKPDCDPACTNGYCYLPDLCRCYNGYSKSETYSHTCEPICDNCVHGTCIKPNVCLCDSGYQMSADGICEPVCDEDCAQKEAYCSAPNECKAFCDLPCHNGRCNAPNICTCNDGYELHPENIFECVPKCESCLYGTCTAPNTCTCDTGYEFVNDRCQPVCSTPCEMGTCIAPETCSCYDGYGLKDSNYVCEPICEKACVNGTCTAPDVCTCHNGFQLSGDETMLHVCEPYCENSCEPYGKCTAPDTCTCFEGYQLANKSHIEWVRYYSEPACVPICNQTCVNGFCSAPGTCSCYPHYKESTTDANVCEPICHDECVNGYCSDPYSCKCYSGYQYYYDPSYCVPVCEQPCKHGTCSAPNKCTCDNGYQTNPEDPFDCKPTCHEECHFGTCTAPDTCTCNSGYSPKNATVCEPVCKKPCVNGFCNAPDICSCDPGYELSRHDSSICEPVCKEGCINGFCDAPNKCSCNEGYESPNNATQNNCVPICEFDCGNGSCTSPNECTCYTGYEKNAEGRCIPFCKVCSNGECVEPEICVCNDGFVTVERGNQSVCEPHCVNCTNGKCVAPDNCQCNVGFIKEGNDSLGNDCISACKDNCNDHGICDTVNRTCDCYYGWNGVNCEEPQFCIVTIDDRIEYLNVTNVEHSVNETIGYVFASSPVCRYNCFDEIGNETLCFQRYKMDNAENDTIACLIGTDSSCYRVYAEHWKDSNYTTIAGIVAVTAITASSVAAIYAVVRKRRKGRFSIDNMSTTSLQGQTTLLSEDDNL